MLKIPRGVITDLQLQQLANHMCIPYFRGFFMRTTLSLEGVRQNESGIINLDNAERLDTHWVAYTKRGNREMFFNSFDNLRPLKELEWYLTV